MSYIDGSSYVTSSFFVKTGTSPKFYSPEQNSQLRIFDACIDSSGKVIRDSNGNLINNVSGSTPGKLWEISFTKIYLNVIPRDELSGVTIDRLYFQDGTSNWWVYDTRIRNPTYLLTPTQSAVTPPRDFNINITLGKGVVYANLRRPFIILPSYDGNNNTTISSADGIPFDLNYCEWYSDDTLRWWSSNTDKTVWTLQIPYVKTSFTTDTELIFDLQQNCQFTKDGNKYVILFPSYYSNELLKTNILPKTSSNNIKLYFEDGTSDWWIKPKRDPRSKVQPPSNMYELTPKQTSFTTSADISEYIITVEYKKGVAYGSLFGSYTTPEYRRYIFTILPDYDGNIDNTFSSTETITPTFNKTSSWWSSNSDRSIWSLTLVTGITTSSGSLDIGFTNVNGDVLESFKAIKGELDGTLCANGDYADIAIQGIFNQLKNYLYQDTIFDNIKNNLAAFFTSIALVKRIVQGTILFNQELVLGLITLTQFQELLDKKYEEYSNQYGNDYVDNYVKLANAIEKYKYLLENTN